MLYGDDLDFNEFCDDNGMEFDSDGEFYLFASEIQILDEEAEDRGEDFDWKKETRRHYRVFRSRRDELKAAEKQEHAVSLSAFNEQELPTLPDELIGGILRKRRKMLLVGPSKAGKTGLLMELAPNGPVSFWYDYPVHRLDDGLSGPVCARQPGSEPGPQPQAPQPGRERGQSPPGAGRCLRGFGYAGTWSGVS